MRHIRLVVLNLLFLSFLQSSAHATQGTPVACDLIDVSIYQWGHRHYAALPTVLNASPGQPVEHCFIIEGVGETPMLVTPQRFELSINGGPYKSGSELRIHDNDELRIRTTAPQGYGQRIHSNIEFAETNPDIRRQLYYINWSIQTPNRPQGERTWYVGSDKEYTQVSQIVSRLHGGDTIILNKDEVFEPFEARYISGTEDAPITLTSNATNAVDRPVITSSTDKPGIRLRGSHYWHVSNIKFKDSFVCFNNASAYTVIENSLFSRCTTGVLGSDYGSGSVTIKNSEFRKSGGKRESGTPWGHPIYVATDQHAFPGATLTVKNSYFRENMGNVIKSRSQNTLIESNWIQAGEDPLAQYLIELIGYDGRYDFRKQRHIVRNNVMIHGTDGLGSRIGGDGKNPSRGSVVFENNAFIFSSIFKQSIVRIFQGLGEFTMDGNYIGFLGDSIQIRTVVDTLTPEEWEGGSPNITVTDNAFGDTALYLRAMKYDPDDYASMINIDPTDEDAVTGMQERIDQLRPLGCKYIDVDTSPLLPR